MTAAEHASGRNWLLDGPRIEWADTRQAYRQGQALLRRLAADRPLVSALVRGVGRDPDLRADCDRHPAMDRLTLLRDDSRGLYLRMHLSRGVNEFMPHDHKYGFTTFILRGAYTHVWRRRTAALTGPFTSRDVTPGVVSIEGPGSCYCMQHTMVHQTIMQRDTVTLFLRGAQVQPRSYAATDLLEDDRYLSALPAGDIALDQLAAATERSHTTLDRRLTGPEYLEVVSHLVALGVIDEPSDPQATGAEPGTAERLSREQPSREQLCREKGRAL